MEAKLQQLVRRWSSKRETSEEICDDNDPTTIVYDKLPPLDDKDWLGLAKYTLNGVKQWVDRMHLYDTVSDIGSAFLPRREYQYSELAGSHETRWIALFSGPDNSAIEIYIFEDDVRQKGAYVSLSYVWGDNDDRMPVLVGDSKVIHVKHNLYGALRRIRKTIPYRSWRYMWVDAICINQKDESEKSHQIPLMPFLYPQGNGVHCWLGEDDVSVAIAFSYLKDWEKAGRNKDLERQEELLEKVLCERTAEQQPTIAALRSLFQKPWFRRAWTLQEAYNPNWYHNKSPILFCGSETISLGEVIFGLGHMTSHLLASENVMNTGTREQTALSMLRVASAPTKHQTYSRLILESSTREATIPRDKIFALLGLLPDSSQCPKPDYDCTDEQICIRFTRAIIERENSLDILHVVQSALDTDSTRTTLPSWCIKLDRKKQWRNQVEESWWNADVPQECSRFAATGTSRPEIRGVQAIDDGALRLQGSQFDRIAKVLDINGHFDDNSATWPSVLQACEDLAERIHLEKPYAPTKESRRCVIARTLCMDDFFTLRFSAKTARLRGLHDFWIRYIRNMTGSIVGKPRDDDGTKALTKEELHKWVMANLPFRERSDYDDTTESGVPAKSLRDAAASGYVSMLATRRRIIVTEGGYVGLDAGSSKPGDAIWLLQGSTVPLLLRQSEAKSDRWHLVSDVYVHGIMYGEAFDEKHMGECCLI